MLVLDRKNREKEAAVHENRGNESGLQAPSNPTCASFTKACDRTHIPTLLGKGRVVFLSNVLTPDGEVSNQPLVAAYTKLRVPSQISAQKWDFTSDQH